METKKQKLLKNIKLYLFDLDGTLYRGEALYPFTKRLLQTLRENGCQYMFATNNSSKSVGAYVEKLKRLGIETVSSDFVTSTQAVMYFLKNNLADRKLYVCGTESMKSEMENSGFKIATEPDEAECIVVGTDTELTYQKLRDVCRLLTIKPEIPYLAASPDEAVPDEVGSVPDCGSICGMIYNATGKRPLVLGKPNPLMPLLALEQYGVRKEEAAIVGDRLDTDILSGLNAGIKGILVMSGETTEKILKNSPVQPSLVLRDAGELEELIPAKDSNRI